MATRMPAAASASRLALAAFALGFAAAPPASAQLTERPCRIVYDDAMKGQVDASTTHGEINLGPRMSQPGGGFTMMGQGKATVTYGPEGQVLSGGCKVTKNRVFDYPVSVIVSSDDGKNGDVDIIPGVFEYRLELNCPGPQGGQMSYDVGVMVPPTVRLPILRGASQTYSEGDRRARLEGTMTLEFCRVE